MYPTGRLNMWPIQLFVLSPALPVIACWPPKLLIRQATRLQFILTFPVKAQSRAMGDTADT